MNRIGILAGGGRLPLTIAESVTRRGGQVHIVGITGEADNGITRYPHTWVNLGQVGRMVTTLRSEGGELVIAGSVRRPNLYKLRPDTSFFRSLPQICQRNNSKGAAQPALEVRYSPLLRRRFLKTGGQGRS